MDRIDIHLDVRRIPPGQVLGERSGASSDELREGVMRARAFADWRRFRAEAAGVSAGSAQLEPGEVRDFLVAQAELHSMSGRAIVRTLAVARTIADMAETETIDCAHIAEAMNFRVRDGIGGR